jgi:LuxR family quorum-sensing system transcriptional regulator CciR
MSLRLASLVDQFDAGAERCTSQVELGHLIEEAVHDLGFAYFALLHHASLARGGARLIRIDNYPSAWVGELRRETELADDPVHLACARTNIGFAWDRLGALIPLTLRQRELLERSARHGLGPGYTVPAHVPGEPEGSCSFAVRRGRSLPARHLHCAELIGARAFGAARRLHGYPAAGARPRLSRREQQCLCLVARGKSDWEIGRILGIGE